MRRGAFLLTLVAVLSGAPLRQAEAAADLTRSLVEFGQAADVEVPDGGVGDDSGVGTLSASHVLAAAVGPESSRFLLLPPPAPPAAAPAGANGSRERVWWPQAPPTARFAWLQVLRF